MTSFCHDDDHDVVCLLIVVYPCCCCRHRHLTTIVLTILKIHLNLAAAWTWLSSQSCYHRSAFYVAFSWRCFQSGNAFVQCTRRRRARSQADTGSQVDTVYCRLYRRGGCCDRCADTVLRMRATRRYCRMIGLKQNTR